MIAQRLTHCVDVVRLWPFFVEGFRFVGRYRKYSLDVTSYRHSLMGLVKSKNAWVGVTRGDDDEPLAFWCAQEITPGWASEREFEIFLRFHKLNCIEATTKVQALFEEWCLQEGVKRYFMTAKKDKTKGTHRFPVETYGMKKAYTVYKKEL